MFRSCICAFFKILFCFIEKNIKFTLEIILKYNEKRKYSRFFIGRILSFKLKIT